MPHNTLVCLYTQPAIYVASLAAIEKIRATEGQAVIDAVNVTCGLSLGEYTALAFAGESLVTSYTQCDCRAPWCHLWLRGSCLPLAHNHNPFKFIFTNQVPCLLRTA